MAHPTLPEEAAAEPNETRAVLPRLSDVKQAIDHFLIHEKWDRHKIGKGPKRFLKSVERLLRDHIGYLPQIVQPDAVLPDLLFYRTRIPTRHFKEQLISDYSFPPNHIVRSYQRCNIPYHPVFYCSDEPGTAVFEAAYSLEGRSPLIPCYLSEWKLRDGMNAHVSPFLFGNVAADSPFMNFSSTNIERIRVIAKDYPKEEVDGFVEVLKFMSRLFVYDNAYSISSFIAHSYLYAPHSMRSDIFIYPSIKTNLKGVNFAIHPNCVQHKMELVRVYKFYVYKLDRETMTCEMRFTHTGVNEKGVIHWRPFKGDEDINRALVSRLRPVSTP